MQRATGTSACASCKHQRKKCTEKCVLAPFFPMEKAREFQAIHKVFGVSNITKIVVNLKEEDRRRAVDSLVWEALCRQKDPVLGPYGDYRRVCEELRLYKSQYQNIHQVPNQGSIVYKAAAAQGLMGWNNNNVLSINGGLNNINSNNNNNSNGTNALNNIEFCSYAYSSHHIQDVEKLRVERENGSALVLPQQHLANGFNQQYFFSGQYNPMDSKSVESTIWEGSS